MSILANTLKVSQSPGGFKCLLNDNAILFCCVQPQNDEHSKEIKKNEEPEEMKEVKDENVQKSEDENKEDLCLEEKKEDLDAVEEKEKEDDLDANEEHPSLLSESKEGNEEVEEEYIEDLDNLSDCEPNLLVLPEQDKSEDIKTAELQIRIGIYTDKPCLSLTLVDAVDLTRTGNLTPLSEEHPVTEIQPDLSYSVHILVLPQRKIRFKSKMCKGPSPYFDEVFKVPKINLESVKSWILRFRLYGNMRSASKNILGEGFLFLEALEFDMRTQCKIALINYDAKVPENVVSTMISSSICNYESMVSLDSIDGLATLAEGDLGPEVLIGLSYNSNIGRLTLEVIKGTNFPRSKKNKYPDTVVSVSLSNTQTDERMAVKTNVKRGNREPVFEENFVFQIPLERFDDVVLTVSGSCKRRIGKSTPFGSFTLGNQSSSDEAANHWDELKSASPGDQVSRWHKFYLPEKI